MKNIEKLQQEAGEKYPDYPEGANVFNRSKQAARDAYVEGALSILEQIPQPATTSEIEKEYQIQFGPDLLCHIKVTDAGVEVLNAMNGWGNNIPADQIQIEPLSSPIQKESNPASGQ